MLSHASKHIEQVSREKADMCQERAVHSEHVAFVKHRLLPVAEAARIAGLFAVLSDPTRLQVMHALYTAPGGELCVCDLASILGRDDTTISHQLRVLRHRQVVTMRKVGRVVYYRLVDEHIRQLLNMGMMHASEETLAPAVEQPAEVSL
ncbi:MAG: winged helix-turn-helix transcriptional regulator [Ktedonobacteraceae bacterium]|nr:winged helix-turn-helix transcriptional regulator [Ktedonobacteraceae bacterium]